MKKCKMSVLWKLECYGKREFTQLKTLQGVNPNDGFETFYLLANLWIKTYISLTLNELSLKVYLTNGRTLWFVCTVCIYFLPAVGQSICK